MASLLLKIVVCPLAVIAAAFLFPNVIFGVWYQPIIVGLVLAAAGTMMEYMILLKRGTLWMSTLLDFAAAVIIVYYISNMFTGALVTFFGAVLTAIIVGLTEHFTHIWLIRTGRTIKSPA